MPISLVLVIIDISVLCLIDICMNDIIDILYQK